MRLPLRLRAFLSTDDRLRRLGIAPSDVIWRARCEATRVAGSRWSASGSTADGGSWTEGWPVSGAIVVTADSWAWVPDLLLARQTPWGWGVAGTPWAERIAPGSLKPSSMLGVVLLRRRDGAILQVKLYPALAGDLVALLGSDRRGQAQPDDLARAGSPAPRWGTAPHVSRSYWWAWGFIGVLMLAGSVGFIILRHFG